MAKTVVDIVRSLIKDDNDDPTKRIFPDDEIGRMCKVYKKVSKKVKLTNEDGLNLRYESFVPYWMDGVESHKSADEAQQFLFASVVYRGLDKVVVDPTEYVVDVSEGAVIFIVAQTEPIYATFQTTNCYHAGADLLDELAAKKSRTALGVQLGSLSVNLAKLGTSLAAEAERLRGLGGPVIGTLVRNNLPPRRSLPSDTNITGH